MATRACAARFSSAASRTSVRSHPTLSVSYTLPDLWSKAIGASRTIGSVAGRNLHTWTSYPGLEPEAMFLGGSRGGNFSAWEQADVPQLMQWVGTVNLI